MSLWHGDEDEVADCGKVVLQGRWHFEGLEMTLDLVAFDRTELERTFGDSGHLVAHPLPPDHAGPLYYLTQKGDLLGPCFLRPEDAQAWADEQPWAPVEWGQPSRLRKGADNRR
jgi:hypothetical protein